MYIRWCGEIAVAAVLTLHSYNIMFFYSPYCGGIAKAAVLTLHSCRLQYNVVILCTPVWRD